jgi:hypothetical protein
MDCIGEKRTGIEVTVSDVYSRLTALRRKVVIYDPSTATVIGEAYINLDAANPGENMYDQIENNSINFSGSLSMEVDGQVAYVRSIVNGQAEQRTGPGPVYNPSLPRTISTVHDCVAYEIEGMNWVTYTLCLVRAPEYYIEQWLSCHWKVCHKHMQYRNPNSH